MSPPERPLHAVPKADDPPPAPAPRWTRNLSDYGNAERLVDQHGDKIMFVPGYGWFVWDGYRWAPDRDGAVMRLMKHTIRETFRSAVELPEGTKGRDELLKHAGRSESHAKLVAAIATAESEEQIVVTSDRLDVDGYALNTLAGTIDLRDGTLRKHSRGDFLTKLAPVTYTTDAECREWQAFLATIFADDTGLIEFVQRLVGVSLSGTTGAQILPICFGTGANGKSTFFALLRKILGEYAHQAPSELLMYRDRSRGGATPDLADLQGRRLVTAIETGESRRLDEPLIKQLTGGDVVNARRLYAEPITFQPTHTLWLATNHKPEIHGTDNAIWRRVYLVPFNVRIPDEKQVDQDTLVARFMAEAPGILRWAVEGCIAWLEDGHLKPPEIVLSATAEYRAEQDVIGAFIEEKCIVNEAMTVGASAIFKEYADWCDTRNERSMSHTKFGRALNDRGFPTAAARGPNGITMRAGLALRYDPGGGS